MSFRAKPMLVYVSLFFIVITATLVRVIAGTLFTGDDAYITFRYARNLVNGLGFVYNQGERILGTTTPLYALILYLFAKLGLDIIWVGKCLNIIAEAGSCVLIFNILRKHCLVSLALLGCFLFAFSPNNVIWAGSGMETGIYTLVVILALWAIAENRWIIAALSSSISVLVRPEGALLLVLLVVWGFVRKVGWKTWSVMLGIAVVLLFFWGFWSVLYFGSPIPNSVAAKRVSYSTIGFLGFVMTFIHQMVLRGRGLGLVLSVLFALGVLSTVLDRRRRSLLVVSLWFFGSFLGYSLGRASGFGWYFAPLLSAYLILVPIGIQVFIEWKPLVDLKNKMIKFPGYRPLGLAVLGIVFLCVVFSSIVLIKGRLVEAMAMGRFESQVSGKIGKWLAVNSPVSSTVCLESIGAVGWYSNRYILDSGGLVSPQVVPLNRSSRRGHHDFPAIIRRFLPDYYIAWSDWELRQFKDDPIQMAWLQQNYHQVSLFSDSVSTWVLFEKNK